MRRGTALLACTGRSTPFSQSRKDCRFSAKSALTVTSSPLRGSFGADRGGLGRAGRPKRVMKRFQSQ
ncbi:hypothetical protein OG291_31100 [Streptomyces halstedii]|uniref:hypothetical protein n=1 Tax=Streptomyces halstedii TaxID=1944 RepID=UPI00386D5A67|nr:hypothetical protein OG291_31100 [Streptomyces halstedii]